jgi:pSer/pThr/pTyr-binding forkhead associated (FHA) protein
MTAEKKSDVPTPNKGNPNNHAMPANPATDKLNQSSAQTGASSRAEEPAPQRGVPRPMVHETQATMAISPLSHFEKEESAIQPTLEVVSGSANQTTFYLGKEKLTIGRTTYNDLILNDPKVSRSHAEIYFEDGHYVIEDLNSTNGVYVDDKLIQKIALKSGSRITLGDSRLEAISKKPE